MHKFAFAIAALAIVGFAAPTIQSANAETIVVKKHRDHDRDWDRRHHHKKIIVIKHRGDRDRDHDHDRRDRY